MSIVRVWVHHVPCDAMQVVGLSKACKGCMLHCFDGEDHGETVFELVYGPSTNVMCTGIY